MADIVTDIAQRLKTIIPGFNDSHAADFEKWVRHEYGKERHYISANGEVDRELSARNRAIISDFKKGERVGFLSRKHKLSRQRIWQIING